MNYVKVVNTYDTKPHMYVVHEIISDFDECQNNRHSCDTTSTTCRNTDGSYHCECKTGYQQDYHYPNKCKGL